MNAVEEIQAAIDTTNGYIAEFRMDYAYTAPEVIPGPMHAYAITTAHLAILSAAKGYTAGYFPGADAYANALTLARAINGPA